MSSNKSLTCQLLPRWLMTWQQRDRSQTQRWTGTWLLHLCLRLCSRMKTAQGRLRLQRYSLSLLGQGRSQTGHLPCPGRQQCHLHRFPGRLLSETGQRLGQHQSATQKDSRWQQGQGGCVSRNSLLRLTACTQAACCQTTRLNHFMPHC
jgi:hypothetical protein